MTDQPNSRGDPLQSLIAELLPWIAEVLQGSTPARVAGPKLIRDAVHGYHLLQPYEVAILDCPIVQRLRYIHQTALAYLVYPTAHHTRFDHSLGMAAVAEKMVNALRVVARVRGINQRLFREVRLAALLHDVGHTFFSHLSESIIKGKFGHVFREIKAMTHKGRTGYFHRAKPGEILSYALITSGPVRRYLEEARRLHRIRGIDIERVAGLVVGQPPDDDHQFMADIINGPIDADKIDYLLRDCHFTGIKAEVDPERIYFTLDVIRLPAWSPRGYLTIKSGGVPHLEQMLLAKMMLFSSIYHHHKIRALECMVKAAFETMSEPLRVRDRALDFGTLRDFFYVSEADWLSAGSAHPQVGGLIRTLLNRRLLKRALVIARPTVADAYRPNLPAFYDLEEEGPEAIRALRQAIHEALPARHRRGVENLWVDIPPGPDIDETANGCWVMLGKQPEILSSVFPSDDWMRSYEAHKTRAHIFYVEDRPARSAVASASQSVLYDGVPPERQLRFNELATLWCKLD